MHEGEPAPGGVHRSNHVIGPQAHGLDNGPNRASGQFGRLVTWRGAQLDWRVGVGRQLHVDQPRATGLLPVPGRKRTPPAQRPGGPERRMPSEGDLPAWGEDPQSVVCSPLAIDVGAEAGKARLRQVELTGDGLQCSGGEQVRAVHDGQRVASKRPVGEDVDNVVPQTGRELDRS